MARGNVGVYKVFYKGDHDDFIIFVEDPALVREWKKDRSIPLARVVSGFKVFVTHRQGSTGIHDGASQVILEAEFGTNDVDKCIGYILERGEIQETEMRERNATTNDSKGILVSR